MSLQGLVRAPADPPTGTGVTKTIRSHNAVCRWRTLLQPLWLWTVCTTVGSTGRTAGCTAGCCTSASMLSTTCEPAADMHKHTWRRRSSQDAASGAAVLVLLVETVADLDG